MRPVNVNTLLYMDGSSITMTGCAFTRSSQVSANAWIGEKSLNYSLAKVLQ
jgi:hypothetical protein